MEVAGTTLCTHIHSPMISDSVNNYFLHMKSSKCNKPTEDVYIFKYFQQFLNPCYHCLQHTPREKKGERRWWESFLPNLSQHELSGYWSRKKIRSYRISFPNPITKIRKRILTLPSIFLQIISSKHIIGPQPLTEHKA